MKILHVCNTLDSPGGGVTHSVGQLMAALNDAGADVQLLAHEGADRPYEGRFPAQYLPGKQHTQYKYTQGITGALESCAPDVVHVHGTWLHINHAAASFARRKDIPLVFSPRGMLYPESFTRRPLVKRAAWALAFRKDLMSADCVHATCEEEAKCIHRLGFQGNIAVIPDLVEDYPQHFSKPAAEGPVRLLYLGRLDKRKGIDLLINALPLLKTEASLTIAGAGNAGYTAYLKSLAGDGVTFVGPVESEEKTRLLDTAEILVMPSDFENFGRVAAEALLSETPIIASHRSPWGWVEEVGCGLILPPERTVEAVAGAIDRLASRREQLAQMGRRGREEALRRFAPDRIAKSMIELYNSVC